MSRRDWKTEPPAPGYGLPGAPWRAPDPDLPGAFRWGYNTYTVKVYETREVVLPNAYRPRRHFAPIGQRCDDCGAGPGERCWDMRSRRRLFRVRPHRTRRLILLTGPALVVRWPVYHYPEEATLW
jgi:hypothetical protein